MLSYVASMAIALFRIGQNTAICLGLAPSCPERAEGSAALAAAVVTTPTYTAPDRGTRPGRGFYSRFMIMRDEYDNKLERRLVTWDIFGLRTVKHALSTMSLRDETSQSEIRRYIQTGTSNALRYCVLLVKLRNKTVPRL